MPTRTLAALTLVLAASTPTLAQSNSSERPAPAAELIAGYAGFADDATIDHGAAGVAARVYLTPRLAIGPEMVYMWGPGFDRDFFLTGNLTFDLLQPQAGRPPRVSPFLVVGGGFSVYRNRFGANDFRSSEGAFTGGGGARVWLTDRVYAVGDFRIGWELHFRVTGGVGVRLGK